MNVSNWTWILIPAAALPLIGAQHANHADGGEKLARVPALSADAQSTPVDFKAWREQLLQPSLEERERAFDRLVDLAARDASVRAKLEEWSQSSAKQNEQHGADADALLAWTARLALREIKQGPRTGIGVGQGHGGALPRMGGFGDLRSRFEELDRRFGNMDSMFQDLQREMDRLGAMGWSGQHGQGGVMSSQSQSYSLQITPDGVHVTTTENVDGKEETREYSAKTMEELLDAHPELRGKIAVEGGHTFHFGAPDRTQRLGDDLFSRRDDVAPRKLTKQPDGAPRTDILGVYFTKPSDAQRKSLSLEEGVGLRVERTEPGTIAALLDVQQGDVIVAVNGRKIREREDVGAALEERKPDQDVVVSIVTRDGTKELTWKAADGSKSSEESRNF